MAKKDNISKYKKIARKHGGECMSETYINSISNLKFKCKFGHIWETAAINVSAKGRWCPFCCTNKKLSLQDAIDFATQFDGYCISTQYINCTSKLSWKCKYGHEWDATFVSVKNSKGWCPQCTGKFFSENIVRQIFEYMLAEKFPKTKPLWLKHNNSQLELDGYSEKLKIAFEHNGTQHYKAIKLFGGIKQLNKMRAHDKKKQILCTNNNIKLIIIPDIYSILGINNVVEFILNEFDKNDIKYDHNKPICNINNIINASKRNPKNSACIMQEIEKIVLIKGGKCLGEYMGTKIKIPFRCKKQHVWSSTWYNIKAGNWCPDCHDETKNRKYSIKDLKNYAISKKGICLSEQYTSCANKYEWQCECSNVWRASWGQVLYQDTWCPKCNINGKCKTK